MASSWRAFLSLLKVGVAPAVRMKAYLRAPAHVESSGALRGEDGARTRLPASRPERSAASPYLHARQALQGPHSAWEEPFSGFHDKISPFAPPSLVRNKRINFSPAVGCHSPNVNLSQGLMNFGFFVLKSQIMPPRFAGRYRKVSVVLLTICTPFGFNLRLYWALGRDS